MKRRETRDKEDSTADNSGSDEIKTDTVANDSNVRLKLRE